ncbi:MAG: hypothetical protein NTU44_20075 [Bacteroidetes bacterium]|nr:hypothetical protein [Bacteroidota bacterium]
MEDFFLTSAIFILTGCCCFSLPAQPVIHWQTFPDYEGIINCMLDLDSAVLAGGDGGLSCINTSTFQVTYLNSCNSGLTGTKVLALEKDTLGSVWIGTSCGLIQWQGNNWTQYTPQNSVLTAGVSAIRYNKSMDALFLGLTNGEVIRKDSNGWNLIVGTNGITVSGQVVDIECDLNGNIWAAPIFHGVYRFDGTDWQLFDQTNIPLYGTVSSIAIDDAGTVWVLGIIAKLVSFDGTAWTDHGYLPFPVNFSHYLSAEENNTLWISTTSGLYIYDGTSYTSHPVNPFLTNGDLFYHLKWKGQKLWTGSFTSGVDFASGLTVTNFPLTPELEQSGVQDIAFDNAQGKVWFATGDNQLVRAFAGGYDDINWYNISVNNSPIHTAESRAIAIDNNSTLFLGTINEGLWMRQGNNWTHYDDSSSNLNNNAITALAVDSNNNLLIGFVNGVVQSFQTNNFITLIQDPNIKSSINHIEPENDTTFWVATDSSGLIRSIIVLMMFLIQVLSGYQPTILKI